MDVFIAIVVLVTLALIATSRRFFRFRRRPMLTLLVAAGWPGVLVGVVIGPVGAGLITDQALLRSAPILTIGLGSIGLLMGLQARWSILRSVPASVLRVVACDAGITTLTVGLVAVGGLALWTDGASPWWTLVPPVAAIVAGSFGWAMETRSLRMVTGSGTDAAAALLRVAAALSAMIAIVVYGAAVKIATPGDTGGLGIDPVGFATWLTLTVGGAVVLGLLGRYAIERATGSDGELLAVFLGVIAFVAGTAAELGQSPLLAGLLTGIVIANLHHDQSARFQRFLIKWEHVLAVMVFVLAGVLIAPQVSGWAFGIAGVAAVLRVVVKPLSLRFVPVVREGGLTLGVMRQSPLALAIALGLVLLGPSAFNRQVLGVVVFAGLFADFIVVALAWRRSPHGSTIGSGEPTGGRG